MSYYVYGSNFSYLDYIQMKSFVGDIVSGGRDVRKLVTLELSKEIREIISSNETLANKNIKTIEDTTEKLSYKLEEISSGISALNLEVSELNSTFHWGFSQLLSNIGRMNDSLSDLIDIAKTPAQTAAYEQYEIARDAFRRSLYEECIESLENAIRTYKLEWRFHHLMGTLRIGFAGCETKLIDLAIAEDSFLLAARYAKVDFHKDAARSYLSAGWAAYCQGKFPEALEHTEHAIAFDQNLGEALFQAAKINIAQGKIDIALPFLSKAIDNDGFFAIKAASDGDFQKYEKHLKKYLEEVRTNKNKILTTIIDDNISKLQSWVEHTHDVECDDIIKKIEKFITNENKLPIIESVELYNSINSIEFIKVQMPATTISCDETYQVEEKYQEEVLVKPAGFFRKAVTEMRDCIRLVTKIRNISKKVPGKIVWVKKIKINTDSKEAGVGRYYYGTVSKLLNFGAYIELFPRVEGIVHISELDIKKVENISDILNIGDKVLVKCTEIDKEGRIRLSRKEALDEFLYGGQIVNS